MDWFSWLSKTSLDPSLVHQYGVVFSLHGLRSDDLAHFSHHFLQSLGVSVADHRLNILKLAGKTAAPKTLSALVLAFNNTRRRVNKFLSKWVPRDGAPPITAAAPTKKRVALSGPLDRRRVTKEMRLSGPLDGKLFMAGKCPKAYGPIAKSPNLNGPLVGRALSLMGCIGDFDDHSIWASLFDDMKPT